MEYIKIISIVSIVFIFLLFLLFKISKNKSETQSKIEIDEKLALKKKSTHLSFDLTLNDSNNAISILGKKEKSKNETPKDKIVKWVETESYEEDIKSQDTEHNHLKNNGAAKISILLVDDSLVVRKYVGDLLRKQNYDIILKNDGFEAITYLNRAPKKLDLIITDIEMPNMNGAELVDAIRKEDKYRSIPILVITAHAESYLDLMESEGIQGFIKKPFEDSDLLAQTDYLINNFN